MFYDGRLNTVLSRSSVHVALENCAMKVTSVLTANLNINLLLLEILLSYSFIFTNL